MIKISVIVPVYNSSAYLEGVCESLGLLAISRTDIEFIFVDDNSKDNSIEILLSLFTKYLLSNAKVYHNSGVGVSDARNTGVNKAIGDYIFFCDSDDTINVSELNDIIDNELEGNEDIILCEYYSISNEKSIVHKSPFKHGKVYSKLDFVGACLLESYLYSSIWRCLFKRVFLVEKNITYLSDVYHEDVLFTLESICNFETIKYLNVPIYNYFLRPSSITTSPENFLNRVSSIEKIIERCFLLRNEHIEICDYINLRLSYLILNYSLLAPKNKKTFSNYKRFISVLCKDVDCDKLPLRILMMLIFWRSHFYFFSNIESVLKKVIYGRI